MVSLPAPLASPIVKDGRPLVHVTWDLTVYLEEASVAALHYLVDWYRQLCPPERLVHYAIQETLGWDRIRHPNLTRQGREALARGEQLPFLAPVRTRIAARRPFFVMFWDGRADDTYCFCYRQVRDAERRLHTFVRASLPLSVEPGVVAQAARLISDQLPLLSGHGGLSFGYNPEQKYDAFTRIYPWARRYWGIDVEDLNGTLTLMKDAIKGIGWLTLVGAPFTSSEALAAACALRSKQPSLQLERRAHAVLFQLGDAPDVGDRNRPGAPLDAMMALGAALSPLVVRGHPAFEGDGFIDHDDTEGWFHRFDDPAGWR